MVLNKFKLKSHISHDDKNSRIYLMDMHPDDFPAVISYMNNLALENKYSKLFAKVPAKYAPAFLSDNYRIEASIPYFYNDDEDAIFLVKYLDEIRMLPEIDELQAFQNILLPPPERLGSINCPGYNINQLGVSNVDSMVSIFKRVFDTYPFPIFDPAFLVKSMNDYGTRYFGAFSNGELAAVSSAECSLKYKNAEMSDFAVIPEHRGNRLATCLLSFMENELFKDGYKVFYTIARLHSLPMNKTFYNMGYKYSGTLTNNTQISGKIESMNVWYKRAVNKI